MIKIDQRALRKFQEHLEEQENSRATVSKYLHDVGMLAEYSSGVITGKSHLIEFKAMLQEKGYAAVSINSMLAAVNRFLYYAGKPEWKLRFLKVQRRTFTSEETELTKSEYDRMVQAARDKGDKRLALLVQAICSTGIRVSEVRAITVESLKAGRAEIRSKGKIREILFPKKLCRELLAYCKDRAIHSGPVFITKTGQPLDRSNIWKMMKQLAAAAKVSAAEVFPHNLRHLFARTYYKTYKDIVRLADILGHTSVDTTRIYTIRSPWEQKHQIEKLPLLA